MKDATPPVSQQVSDDYKLLLSPPFSTMSRITDNLFLTGVGGMTRTNFAKNHIDFVVNITTDAPFWEDTESMRIALEDDAAANVLAHLDFAVDKIHEVITKRNAHVLVHCVAGVSRSATIVIAYLMKYRRLDLKTAFNYCFNLRPVIRPNNGFMIQLIKYEQQLFGRSPSVQMVEVEVEGLLVSVPNFFLDEHPRLVMLEVLRARDLKSKSEPSKQQLQQQQVIIASHPPQAAKHTPPAPTSMTSTTTSQPTQPPQQPQQQQQIPASLPHKHSQTVCGNQQHQQAKHGQRTLLKSDTGSVAKSSTHNLVVKSVSSQSLAVKSAAASIPAVKSTTTRQAKSPSLKSPSAQSRDGT